jgi:hypothetical protein
MLGNHQRGLKVDLRHGPPPRHRIDPQSDLDRIVAHLAVTAVIEVTDPVQVPIDPTQVPVESDQNLAPKAPIESDQNLAQTQNEGWERAMRARSKVETGDPSPLKRKNGKWGKSVGKKKRKITKRSGAMIFHLHRLLRRTSRLQTWTTSRTT